MLGKSTLILLLTAVWLMVCGFSGLEIGGQEDTLNALLDQLTEEDYVEIFGGEEWSDRVMAKVDQSVCIREEANTDASIVGKMYKGSCGDILERGNGWTKVQTGEVTGWVSNDYLAFGAEARERANLDVPKIAKVITETLKVRDEATTDAKVIDLIGMGEEIEVGAEKDGWMEILYTDGEVDYISAEYVEVESRFVPSKTMAEIKAEEAALEAAKKAAKEKAAAEKKKAALTKNQGKVPAAADDVTLLAALIQAESGNQPYEGQLAVGAVVMNRVRSASYPNTISAVIYAPGQFGPAATGKVAQYLAAGPKASCIQAAQAALNGETTVGDATHFHRAGSTPGIVIGAHVFY